MQRKNPNWRPSDDGTLFMSQLKESGIHSPSLSLCLSRFLFLSLSRSVFSHTLHYTTLYSLSLSLQWRRCRGVKPVLLEEEEEEETPHPTPASNTPLTYNSRYTVYVFVYSTISIGTVLYTYTRMYMKP